MTHFRNYFILPFQNKELITLYAFTNFYELDYRNYNNKLLLIIIIL